MGGQGDGELGRTYTRGRRQPYLIRKWPGSNWVLPLGPYTITQLLVFVGSIYLLLTYRDWWAHFGPGNLLIGAGLPAALTYATRHTRIEGRDPLRAAVAVAGLLTRPRDGYLNGGPVRHPRPLRLGCGHFPVAAVPAALAPAPPRGDRPAGTAPPPAGRWVADLVADAARKAGAQL
jgi:hypothetical protein